jgi:hypothetical protein
MEIGEMAVALCGDTGEFVRIPPMPAHAQIRSLAYDGTRLILVAPPSRPEVVPSSDGTHFVLMPHAGGRRPSKVGMVTLENGEERWFDAAEGVEYVDAMLSPNGETVAILFTEEQDPEVAYPVVDLLDAATGQCRRLWQGRYGGAPVGGSHICWSPDGKQIAVTYMVWDDELDDDAMETVVIDAEDGAVRSGPYPYAYILVGTYLTWTSDHELAYKSEASEIHHVHHVDVVTGYDHAVPGITGHILGVVNGRHIHQTSGTEKAAATGTDFYTTDLQGTDRKHLLTILPKVQLNAIHVAPGTYRP